MTPFIVFGPEVVFTYSSEINMRAFCPLHYLATRVRRSCEIVVDPIWETDTMTCFQFGWLQEFHLSVDGRRNRSVSIGRYQNSLFFYLLAPGVWRENRFKPKWPIPIIVPTHEKHPSLLSLAPISFVLTIYQRGEIYRLGCVLYVGYNATKRNRWWFQIHETRVKRIHTSERDLGEGDLFTELLCSARITPRGVCVWERKWDEVTCIG